MPYSMRAGSTNDAPDRLLQGEELRLGHHPLDSVEYADHALDDDEFLCLRRVVDEHLEHEPVDLGLR